MLPPLASRELCQSRLAMIFPVDSFPSGMSNLLAASAVAGLLWAGCVVNDDQELTPDLPYARPTTILWMNHDLIQISDESRRVAWYAASLRTKAKAHLLMEEWGIGVHQWYADNTRESVRDDAYIEWSEQGAMLGAPHVQTTASSPRWILPSSFAELFNPALTGDELNDAVEAWTGKHMSTAGKLRAHLSRARAQAAVSVNVTLPDGSVRQLSPGNSSLLVKGVVEGWSVLRLKDPEVIAISESRDKIHVIDNSRLASIGLAIDVTKLLPDLLMVDVGKDPLDIWVIEVVSTTGPIDERRKLALEKWAKQQGLPVENVSYMTAFLSRHHAAAKRFVPTLAEGSYAWFLDEPENELEWRAINSAIPDNVTSIHPK